MTQLEREARQDQNICHIDGPARAFFDIPFGEGAERGILRIVYFSVIWSITEELIEDNAVAGVTKQLTTAIEDELYKLGGGIIWWRVRPELATYSGPEGQIFKVRARVATSPPLSAEAWTNLHMHAEGQRIT
jgi:hypothetical protein